MAMVVAAQFERCCGFAARIEQEMMESKPPSLQNCTTASDHYRHVAGRTGNEGGHAKGLTAQIYGPNKGEPFLIGTSVL